MSYYNQRKIENEIYRNECLFYQKCLTCNNDINVSNYLTHKCYQQIPLNKNLINIITMYNRQYNKEKLSIVELFFSLK